MTTDQFILGLLVLFFIGLWGYYKIKDRQAKKMKWKYNCDYATAVFMVEYSIVDKPGFKTIQEKFDELWKSPYCNKERCQVLEQQFYKKFAEFVIKKWDEEHVTEVKKETV
jgi:hypothetical protein